jgi:hypothetical protein
MFLELSIGGRPISVIAGMILPTSTRLNLVMDIATFAARPESYDRLSLAQISTFFSSNMKYRPF